MTSRGSHATMPRPGAMASCRRLLQSRHTRPYRPAMAVTGAARSDWHTLTAIDKTLRSSATGRFQKKRRVKNAVGGARNLIALYRFLCDSLSRPTPFAAVVVFVRRHASLLLPPSICVRMRIIDGDYDDARLYLSVVRAYRIESIIYRGKLPTACGAKRAGRLERRRAPCVATRSSKPPPPPSPRHSLVTAR